MSFWLNLVYHEGHIIQDHIKFWGTLNTLHFRVNVTSPCSELQKGGEGEREDIISMANKIRIGSAAAALLLLRKSGPHSKVGRLLF